MILSINQRYFKNFLEIFYKFIYSPKIAIFATMKLVLLGYMGSGKSLLGEEIARALGSTCIDLDSEIEKREGMGVADIFLHKSEIHFRKTEAVVLEDLLGRENNLVIATGGGTPCYGTIMQDLQQNEEVITVYLKCSIDTLTTRLFDEKSKRPLIAHLETKELLNDFIRKHLFERSYYYNQASIVINCDEQNSDEIVQNLVMKLF
jgi:shikimate kinase